MASTFDRGSAIIIEATLMKTEPFESSTLWDPTSVTISVYDAAGNAKVSGQSMTRKDTGKYYYILQTEEDWDSGYYAVEIEASDASYSDRFYDDVAFELV